MVPSQSDSAPKESSIVIDDVFNDAEVNMEWRVLSGKRCPDHRGPRAWHGSREAMRTCETSWVPGLIRGAYDNRKKSCVTIHGESDQFIVLSDGSAVHMGKGLARKWNRKADQVLNA